MAKTAKLAQENDALRALVDKQAAKIAALQEELRLALHKRFSASSEKASPDQLNLFNEAEVTAATPTTDDLTTTVPEHERKTRGRKPLPDHLPRTRIEHDIPDADKLCACGCQKTRIGEATSEQLDIIPAKIQVLQNVRFKYACRACEGTDDDGPTVVTAAMPPQPIPKSNASSGLLAYIGVAKFVDGMPLYRLEARFKRIGVEIPRNTLAGWMIRCGALIVPLINLMQKRLLDHDIIQMDETTVQVLKEKGRAPQSQSYMWVRRGGPPDQTVILFDYDPSRGGKVPVRLLESFRGILQTDGYEGYAAVTRGNDIAWIGCLAHARRKFDEALQSPKEERPGRFGQAGLRLLPAPLSCRT